MINVRFPKSNLHTHSLFCDGRETPEEIVREAIRQGMTAIGFSGHSPMPYFNDFAMTEMTLHSYREEITRLKRAYAGQIDIFLGIEQDYLSGYPCGRFDYVIGSVHHIPCEDGTNIAVDSSAEVSLTGINRYLGGDIYTYAEEYFRMVGEIVEKTNADLIGHFDLLTKFCDRGLAFDAENPRYVAAWKAAADKLLKTGVPFEINTGAISRGYRKTPYPALDIMHYLAENGGKAVITSDSHTTDGLGCACELAYNLAKEAGLPLTNKVGNIEF